MGGSCFLRPGSVAEALICPTSTTGLISSKGFRVRVSGYCRVHGWARNVKDSYKGPPPANFKKMLAPLLEGSWDLVSKVVK